MRHDIICVYVWIIMKDWTITIVMDGDKTTLYPSGPLLLYSGWASLNIDDQDRGAEGLLLVWE